MLPRITCWSSGKRKASSGGKSSRRGRPDHRMRRLGYLCLAIAVAIAAAVPAAQFVNATSATKIEFTQANSATTAKYLPETMGGGVAVLDYDNDGRLDVFFVNGAKISDP